MLHESHTNTQISNKKWLTRYHSRHQGSHELPIRSNEPSKSKFIVIRYSPLYIYDVGGQRKVGGGGVFRVFTYHHFVPRPSSIYRNNIHVWCSSLGFRLGTEWENPLTRLTRIGVFGSCTPICWWFWIRGKVSRATIHSFIRSLIPHAFVYTR